MKIAEEEIVKTDFHCSEPTLFEIYRDGVKFEFLICYKESDHAVVLGTGNAHRELYALPIMVRHSWAKDFSCTSIFYADPTLYLNDLTLTWYYGTNKRWYLKEIADILNQILDKLCIKPTDALFFGSSGGGYSSIALATMLRSKATVINPQCNILNYNKEYIGKFLNAILSDGEEVLTDRTDVINIMKEYGYFPYIHYIQNVKCKYDLKDQLFPFLSALDENDFCCTERLKVDFYSDKGGHNAMPSKDYCLSAIEDDVYRDIPNYDTALYLCDSYVNGIGINTDVKYQDGILSIRISTEKPDTGFMYAFYLTTEKKEIVRRIGFSKQAYCEFDGLSKGKYRIKYYIQDEHQKRVSFFTDYFEC